MPERGPRAPVTFELALRLQQSHLFCVPSSYEGFGIVYLEGMGFGLPAIATTAGSAGEIITHGLDGYLIAPGEARSLAQHLRELAENRPKLARLGQAALRRFSSYATWEQTGAQIRNFLLQLRGS